MKKGRQGTQFAEMSGVRWPRRALPSAVSKSRLDSSTTPTPVPVVPRAGTTGAGCGRAGLPCQRGTARRNVASEARDSTVMTPPAQMLLQYIGAAMLNFAARMNGVGSARSPCNSCLVQ